VRNKEKNRKMEKKRQKREIIKDFMEQQHPGVSDSTPRAGSDRSQI